MNAIRVKALITIVFATAMMGCSHLRLHSEVREKQGQAAAKAWSEVDLSDYFKAERENQVSLTAVELETGRKQVDRERARVITDLAQKNLSDMPDHFDDSLKGYVQPEGAEKVDRAKVDSAIKTAVNSLDARREHQRRFERDYSFLLADGFLSRIDCSNFLATNDPDLAKWKAKNPQAAGRQRAHLGDATTRCQRIREEEGNYLVAIESLSGGSLHKLATNIKEAQEASKKRADALAKVNSEYIKAKAAYEAAVDAAAPGESTTEKAKELAEQVQAALKLLEEAGGLAGKKLASEDRLEDIDAVLESLKAGKPIDQADASKVAIVITSYPKIADDIRAIGQAKKGAGVVALLMQRDLEQARLNVIKTDIAIAAAGSQLKVTQLESSVRHANELVNARTQLMRVDPLPKLGMSPAWETLTAQQRRDVLGATSLYVYAHTNANLEKKALAVEEVTLSNKRSLAMAEINASMWSALIGGTVTQAADFSALGIKAADLENVLALLGILYIGHGVNK